MNKRKDIDDQLRAFCKEKFEEKYGSQASCAREISYDPSNLNRWIKGEITPSADAALAVLHFFGFDILAWLRSTKAPGAELQAYLGQDLIARAIKTGLIRPEEIELLKTADRLGALAGKSFLQIEAIRVALRRVLGIEDAPEVKAELKARRSAEKPRNKDGRP